LGDFIETKVKKSSTSPGLVSPADRTSSILSQAYEKSRLDIRKSFYHKITMTKTAFNNKNKMNCELMLTYDTPALRQTASRNLTGPKTLPTIWHTYMKLVTKYQIPVINSCLEKCDEK
jgi:hypothetical protein